MVAIDSNGNILATTKQASTLPDIPNLIPGVLKAGYHSVVVKDDYYRLRNSGHLGYAAGHLFSVSGDEPLACYDYKCSDGINGGPSTAIDFHVAYTYNNPSTTSQGCIVINHSDYIDFCYANGLVNSSVKTKFNDNVNYVTFKTTFSYDKYTKGFDGYIVIDRKIMRNKIYAIDRKDLLLYYGD